MSEAGPIRIIEVASGAHYCDDCHDDITGDDEDRSMYVHRRLLDGVCECCGIVIDDGYADDIIPPNLPAD